MNDLLNLFSILSDKTRLRILLLLMDNELCVCEIFAALDLSQPRVSQQLAILKQSKIIKDRRVGKWIYYKIDQNLYTTQLFSILKPLPDWLKDDPDFKNDKEMLNKVSNLKDKSANCECKIQGGEFIGE